MYGILTSGLRWHARLADYLRDMEFEPCKIKPNIWLCPCREDHYEYIAVYVYDLLITSKDTKSTIDVLTDKHYFKLKGTGPISYNLGCNFGRNDDGTLNVAPKKYNATIVD